MKAIEVGTRLVELFNAGNWEPIYAELYSPEIVSIEADGMESKGMEGINAKNEWWAENFEAHSLKATGPFPHGDNLFAVVYDMDTTHKPSGQRSQMQEVGVYELQDGKIVRERFCYAPEEGA
ncbi:MAG: nuclear transport factor 2 family protein [Armatimonadetes bacterium]|nr:nuclear transport factor 2 family protein [Armatimonadota bacterium]